MQVKWYIRRRPATARDGQISPEKRKVGSSTLPLTTSSRTISQPSYLRRQREERVSRGTRSAPGYAFLSPFRLHLAAKGKAGRTLHTYTEAVRWFAAAAVRGKVRH